MIVIIEGLDGVGKTTFAKKFAEMTGFEYVKESYTDDVIDKEQRLIRLKNRLKEEKNYIYDRTTMIDDFVYGFLNQTESSLIKYKEHILEVLSKCKIFHLTVDEQTRKKRFEERGDEFVTEEMISKIKDCYLQFYKQLSNVEYFDLSNDNEENVKKMIRRICND